MRVRSSCAGASRMRKTTEKQYHSKEDHNSDELLKRTQEECADAERHAEEHCERNHLSLAPSFRKEPMVEMIEIAFEWRASSENSGDGDENRINKRQSENEECRCYFSTRIDRERSEHEPEEHCSRITHNHFIRRKIEERSSECNS